MAILAAAYLIRLGKALTSDLSLPTLSEAFFGSVHGVPDLPIEPILKDDRDALFTLFTQTVSRWDRDVEGILASIGAVESDLTEEHFRRAFIFALNLNNVKLGPPKEVSVDHALHAMKIQAKNLNTTD